MSTTIHTPEIGKDDIEMLLPWFVTGKLDAAETKQVEAYLEKHPEMRKQLDLLEEDRQETMAGNEAMGSPSADALSKLMKSIDDQSLARRSGFASLAGVVQTAIDWLGSRQALVPVAAAAAVALIVQAGAIGALLWGGSATPKGFGQASPPVEAPAEPGPTAMVGFQPTASIHAIETALAPLGMTIIDGPRAGGIYRLRLSDKPLSDAERDLLLTALKANTDVVRFVAAGPN